MSFMANQHQHARISRARSMTNWNINYAHKRQQDAVNSSSTLVPTSTDTPTPVLYPASPVNSGSIISITALPPLTVAPSHTLTKLPYHQHLNVIFLAPLFLALGIVLGVAAVSLWFKFHPLTGRRYGASSRITLEPGPSYAPPPDDDDNDRSMDQVALLAAGTPSKSTVHGARYLSSMRDTKQQNTQQQLCTPFLMGASTLSQNHGDPFAWTHLSSSSSGTYDAERADADDPRRSMFDRMISNGGSRYAAVGTLESGPISEIRLVSALNSTADIDMPVGYEGRSTAVYVPHQGGDRNEVQRPARAWLETPGGAVDKRAADENARRCKVVTVSDQGHKASHAEVETPTPAPRTPVSKLNQFWKKNKGLPLLSSRSPASMSPITRSPRSPSPMPRSAPSSVGLVPERRGRVKTKSEKNRRKKKIKEALSPTKTSTTTSIKTPATTSIPPQIDSSVLPRSPPFLMSPPLEAALLFTTTSYSNSCGAVSFASLARSSSGLGLGSGSLPCSTAKSKAKMTTMTTTTKPNREVNGGEGEGEGFDSPLRSKTDAHTPDISLFPLPRTSKLKSKSKSKSRSRRGEDKEKETKISRNDNNDNDNKDDDDSSPMLPFPFPSTPDADGDADAGAGANPEQYFVHVTPTRTLTTTTTLQISPTPTMLAVLAAAQSLERVNEILVRGYSGREREVGSVSVSASASVSMG